MTRKRFTNVNSIDHKGEEFALQVGGIFVFDVVCARCKSLYCKMLGELYLINETRLEDEFDSMDKDDIDELRTANHPVIYATGFIWPDSPLAKDVHG